MGGIEDAGLDEFLLGVSSGMDDAVEDRLRVVGGLEALLSVEFASLVFEAEASDVDEALLTLTILFKVAEAGRGGNMMSAGTVGNKCGCGKQFW